MAGATTGAPLLLALSTSSAALSVALFDGDRLAASAHDIIGRGHAEALVTTIARVLAQAGASRADAIVVDIGPGSYTGVRIGVAAARALGLAWNAPVNGCRATALVAAAVFADQPGQTEAKVLIDAGRGHFYAETLGRDLAAGPLTTVEARDAMAAGLPDARLVLQVPVAARSLPPRPVYVAPPGAVLAL